MNNRRSVILILILITGLTLAGFAAWMFFIPSPVPVSFSGQRAYEDVRAQVAFGPRTVGSEAHEQFIEWLRENLSQAGWESVVIEDEVMGHPIKNILATRGFSTPQILLMAHYDSRLVADNDPDLVKQSQPVPGANDGASGVAVLLELARTLPQNSPVGLLFLDAEDNGRIEGWDWILGSRSFVETMDFKPQAVILVDMIGDKDLNIYMEKNSDKGLTREIWDVAKSLGYGHFFIPETKFSVLDDHIPFIEKDIPAVDIIDLDYPQWHTTSDTPDKVAAESLEAVGNTLWHWIVRESGN